MTLVDHSFLVDSMKDPGFYPHPVEAVGFIETHISSVFLTGAFAYKLKKPMDFGFLDFTSIDLRRHFCEREVELNRRLAPSVYLRVEPLTLKGTSVRLGGPGPVVDWVVVMRQLDQSLLGPEVLRRGELTAQKIESVVDTLVPFYQRARTGPDVDEFGNKETVKFNTDENFEQTADNVGSALSQSQYDQIRSFTNQFYQGEGDIFRRRVDEGWVRECHGDLHLGNIFFEDPPVIFDCIEFNDRFRCSDVAADLAFLVMDLDFQKVPELARLVVERYVERSPDPGVLDLVDFYCCYRAYVRGKIACLTMADPGIGAAVRNQQVDLARRYFELAHLYATDGGHGRGLS